MITDRRIVCLSSLAWEFLPTSRHHLTSVLAKHGNQVLYVDPPANLARPSDVRAYFARRRAAGVVEDVAPNVIRLTPPPRLPYAKGIYFDVASRANERSYASAVGKAVTKLGWHAPVLWDVCIVQLSQGVPDAIAPSAYVIHMTDDLWSYDWYHSGYDPMLRRAAKECDIALGSSSAIARRLETLGFDARELRHGVDAERFEPVARGQISPEPRLAGRRRPRLGFVGNIESRLDLDVVERLARSEGSVTLVGPVRIDGSMADRLRAAGCHLDGEIDYADVPRWLAGFDIALLPYKSTPIVKSSRPLKLLEYVAAGLPVVATDIPAARDLQPHVVTALTPQDFEDAVRELWRSGDALSSAPARAVRAEAARSESWHLRGEELAAVFVDAEEKRAARHRRTRA